MLRKTISFILVMTMLFIAGSARTEGSKLPPDEVFEDAKAAVMLMSQKQFDQAIKNLDAESWLNPAKLKQQIDKNLKHFYGSNVQTDYSVAWVNGNGLYLAVPVYEPSDGYVDTVVFALSPDFGFSGIGFVAWADVEQELTATSYIKWNIEYLPSYTIFVD